MENKKSKAGGKRKGAGRPRLEKTRRKKVFYLDTNTEQSFNDFILTNKVSASQLCNDALTKYLKCKKNTSKNANN